LKLYEGMFLLKTGDIAGGSHLDLVKGIIEKREGVVKEIRKWDERKLAYEIDRNRRGLYILAYFEAPQDSIPQIKRDCALSENVLRLLILRADDYSKRLAVSEGAPEAGQPPQPKEESAEGPRAEAAGEGAAPGVPGESDKVTG